MATAKPVPTTPTPTTPPAAPPAPKYLTVQQCAEWFGRDDAGKLRIYPNLIVVWIHYGRRVRGKVVRLPAVRPAKCWLIAEDDWQAFCEATMYAAAGTEPPPESPGRAARRAAKAKADVAAKWGAGVPDRPTKPR